MSILNDDAGACTSATSRIFMQSQLDSLNHAAQVVSLERTCMRGLTDHVSITKASNYKLRLNLKVELHTNFLYALI